MDYGKLLRRSWDLLIEQKYLIILGVLAALGSSGSSSSNWQSSGGDGSQEGMPSFSTEGFNFEMPALEGLDWFWLLPAAGLIALIAFAILLGILVWVVGVIAHGGLIAGVNGAEEGESMTFGQAWGAAWSKGWRLIGIRLLPAIPLLIFFALGVGAFVLTIGLTVVSVDQIWAAFGAGLIGLFVCLVCLLIPILIVLEVMSIFAMRACMLEDAGVFDAYRRGVAVIRENGTEFIALFLLRVGIGIVIGVLLFLPGFLMAFCCIFWPLLLLVKGVIAAYFSALWTLAWREWTGMIPEPQLTDVPTEA